MFIANEVYNYARGGPVMSTIIPAKPALTMFLSAYHPEEHRSAFRGTLHEITQNNTWDPRSSRPLHGSIWDAKCSGPDPFKMTPQHYPGLRQQHRAFNGLNLVQIVEMWAGRSYGEASVEALGDADTKKNRDGSCLQKLEHLITHVIGASFLFMQRPDPGFNVEAEQQIIQMQMQQMQQAGLAPFTKGVSLVPKEENNGIIALAQKKWKVLQDKVKAAEEEEEVRKATATATGSRTSMGGKALQPGEGHDQSEAIQRQLEDLEAKIQAASQAVS